MQRRKVLLPEPEEPRIEITSPFWASTEMPFSTSRDPKLLWMSLAINVAPESWGELALSCIIFPLQIICVCSRVAMLCRARCFKVRRSTHPRMRVMIKTSAI